MANTKSKLEFRDSDGIPREVKGCTLTVDALGRHWIWSEQLQQNIVYNVKGREDALLSSINSLLFLIELKDERIKELQRIADLAESFASKAFPAEENWDD
jgi:hypothetical protein